MNKKNKKLSIFAIIYLLVSPVVFSLFSLIFVKTVNIDYNSSLLANIVNSSENVVPRFTMRLETKNPSIDGWNSYSKIFNRDFYGSNTVYRTTKDVISLSSPSISSTVLLSDIQQCDLPSYESNNFSLLKIKASMEDFTDESIFISDDLATQLRVVQGDKLYLNKIELSVDGIYSRTPDSNYFLNNAYYEFGASVCFVSNKIFNELAENRYDAFVTFHSKKELINAAYVELTPIVKENNILLSVDERFSMNNFTINGQKLKDLQNTLLTTYLAHNNFSFYFFVVSLVALLITNLALSFVFSKKIILNHKMIFKSRVLITFLYSLYVLGFVLLSALFLHNFMTVAPINGILICRPISSSLLFLSFYTVLQIAAVAVSVVINSKQPEKKLRKDRREELFEMQKKNNKVIFVTGSLTRGGAEKVIVELANKYASMGKKVEIVILLNHKIEWDLNKKIKVIDYAGNTNSRIKRIRYWIKSLKTYFKENANATIVSFLVRVNLLVLLTAKRSEHKIIISERNDPRSDGRNDFIALLVNILYPRADIIVFQTKECKELFSTAIQEKGIVIPNPITIKQYAHATRFDHNRFITAGRIAPQKDQEVIIKAMRKVVEKRSDVIFDIYGDGDLTDKLNLRISKYGLQNNVHIYPNTKNINEKILRSNCYVCTSLYEGMSNSLMEASYAGVPCITTKCLGTDFIKEGENGFFIGFHSSKDLANCILSILDNHKENVKLRKRAIEIARKTSHDDVFLKWRKCIGNE